MSAGTYPALGFDPAPGDVFQVAALVSTLRSVGTEMSTVRDELRAIGHVQGAWIGKAATAFVGQLGELPTYLDRASNSTDTALRALSGWERDLEDFERRGRMYEQRAEEARQRVTSARASLDALPQDGGQMDQRQVEELHDRTRGAQRAFDAADGELSEIVRAARNMLGEHQARAGHVATLVRQASDTAPPEPGFWENVGDALKGIGDFFTNIADTIVEFVREHAELFKLIGDLLADLALVVGIAALVVGLFISGPVGWGLLIAAGGLSLGALATHGAAKAGGADVSWTTLVLDGLGVLSAGAGLAGLRMTAAGARTVQSGRSTMAGARWFNVGAKLRGAATIGKGKIVEFGGRTVSRSGDAITVGSSGTSVGGKLRDEGASWRSIPVLGSTANLVDHFTDDGPEAVKNRGSVSTAGRAFSETAASHRNSARLAAAVG